MDLLSVCSSFLRETKQFDFSHHAEDNIMDSTFGKSFLFLTKLAWNCKVTLPVLVTAVFLAMDFRMQIELNIETEQLVFQVSLLNLLLNDCYFHLVLFHKQFYSSHSISTGRYRRFR